MLLLVACEYSGVVRRAFREVGHDAWSCDLLESEDDSEHHIHGDALDAMLWQPWDMVIAHPPCTDLATSGARHFEAKRKDGRQRKSIEFFMEFAESGFPKLAIENPIGIMSSLWRKPDQIIQPWQFGHGEVKSTCLWLHGLPLLTPTNIVYGREERILRMPESKDRWKLRSRTYEGIAKAMAEQWGSCVPVDKMKPAPCV